jgi:hypothetical protein
MTMKSLTLSSLHVDLASFWRALRFAFAAAAA